MTVPGPLSGISRRTFLRRTAVASGIAFGLPAAASGEQTLRWVIIPRIDPVDEYRAQVLFVGNPDEADAEQVPEQEDPGDLPEDDPEDVPVADCEFEESWPSNRTTRQDVLLIHRHAHEPVSYDITIYTDEEQESLEEGRYYITHQTATCSDDYVATQIESVPEGEAPEFDPEHADEPEDGQVPGTPTGQENPEDNTPEDGESTDVPGFGAIAAIAGVAIALAVRSLQRRGSD